MDKSFQGVQGPSWAINTEEYGHKAPFAVWQYAPKTSWLFRLSTPMFLQVFEKFELPKLNFPFRFPMKEFKYPVHAEFAE